MTSHSKTVGVLAPMRSVGGMLLRTLHVAFLASVGTVAAAVGLCVLGLLLCAGLTVGAAVLVYSACVYIIGE